MRYQARIDRYTGRGFQQTDAQILVLMEEAAAALFESFPERFILFGGATLVLFFDSPRLSRDLDLLATSGDLPSSEEIQAAVRFRIQAIADAFALGRIEFGPEAATPTFHKQSVFANRSPLFTIDVTSMGGSVLESQIVKQAIADAPRDSILTPGANYLLLQKCESFLGRRYLKTRDAFDIYLLLSRGAQLGETLRAHLHDFLVIQELDKESIVARIEAVTPNLCTVELRPVLPPFLFEQLERNEFETLRSALRTAFSDYVGEAPQ